MELLQNEVSEKYEPASTVAPFQTTTQFSVQRYNIIGAHVPLYWSNRYLATRSSILVSAFVDDSCIITPPVPPPPSLYVAPPALFAIWTTVCVLCCVARSQLFSTSSLCYLAMKKSSTPTSLRYHFLHSQKQHSKEVILHTQQTDRSTFQPMPIFCKIYTGGQEEVLAGCRSVVLSRTWCLSD